MSPSVFRHLSLSFDWRAACVVEPCARGFLLHCSGNSESCIVDRSCVRQAGRQVIVAEPVYADLDVEVTLCLEDHADRNDAQVAAYQLLVGPNGFFNANNFTFGTPLRRSALEDVLMKVPGIRAVTLVRVRRRGLEEFGPSGLLYTVESEAVIRVENDALKPERGSLFVNLEGGL